MSLAKDEDEMIRKSGKFFGEADRKFAGSPKALLLKTEEKVEHFRRSGV